MGHLEKQTSDQSSAQETGTEAARTPIKAITLFSTPRVARPQTDPPATSSNKRQRLKLGRKPRESEPRPPSSGDPRGPSREQDERGSSPGSQGPGWPALLLPPPHPGRTRSASPTRSKRPKMHQPITSSAAAAAIFASGPDRPEGEGREGTGTERDPEPRSLKVKGVEGRSGRLPRRPDPRASPGDHPNRGGAHPTRRDVTTLPAHAQNAFRGILVVSESLYREWILCHWMFKWGLGASMTPPNEVLFPVCKQKSSWCRNESGQKNASCPNDLIICWWPGHVIVYQGTSLSRDVFICEYLSVSLVVSHKTSESINILIMRL